MFRIIERTGKKGRKKKKTKQYSALPVYKAYTVRHGHTHTHTGIVVNMKGGKERRVRASMVTIVTD
jgi:hypothetical protein